MNSNIVPNTPRPVAFTPIRNNRPIRNPCIGDGLVPTHTYNINDVKEAFKNIFFLNQEEINLIQNGVDVYCSEKKIEKLVYSIFDYFKNSPISTPWQKAIKVLESKLDGEEKTEVAIFLLTFFLTTQKSNTNQSTLAPLEMGIKQSIERANCTIIQPLEKIWNGGKNPYSTINTSEY